MDRPDRNEMAAWRLKIEELTEEEVDGFKRFLFRMNSATPDHEAEFSFEDRGVWMMDYLDLVRSWVTMLEAQFESGLYRPSSRTSITSATSSLPNASDSEGPAPSIKSRTSHTSLSSRMSVGTDPESATRSAKPNTSYASRSFQKSIPIINLISDDEEEEEEEEDIGPLVLKSSGSIVKQESSPEPLLFTGSKRKRTTRRTEMPQKRHSSTSRLSSVDNYTTSDSSSDDLDLESKHKSKGKGSRTKKEGIMITRQQYVDEIKEFNFAPHYYPPNDDESKTVGYLLDLTEFEHDDREKTVDGVLKNFDYDSWGNDGKSTTGGSNKSTTNVPLLGHNIKAKRSALQCQGTHHCSLFKSEQILDDDYVRSSGDVSEWAKIMRNERKHKQELERDELFHTAIFHRSVLDVPQCSLAGCKGVPYMRTTQKQNSSNQDWFVGCSHWTTSNPLGHRSHHPGPAVNKEIYLKLFHGEVVEEAIGRFETCSYVRSPKSGGRTACAGVHFKDGEFLISQVKSRPCPVRRVCLTPNDNKIRKAIILFIGQHNHPQYAPHKLTIEEDNVVSAAMESYGKGVITAQCLREASSTKQLVKGDSLIQAHPALLNKRLQQKAITKQHRILHPEGDDWPGVLVEYTRDQTTDPDSRYYWIARFENGLHILVTMLRPLAEHIHTAPEIAVDFTFKRVDGNVNEWEVALWSDYFERRLTVARVYSNATNTHNYKQLWCAFFDAIKMSTGKSIKFYILHGSGPIAIIADAEIAQAQGLAEALMHLDGVDQANYHNRLDILPHVLLMCRVHFTHNLEHLRPKVSKEDFTRLGSITGLQDPEEIAEWRTFCKSHPCREVKDWFQNKASNEWMLSGICPGLSQIPEKIWKSMRHHTNLTETGHAYTNKHTGIRLPLRIAVETARGLDTTVCAELIQADKEGLVENRQNKELHRAKRAATRRNRKIAKSIFHSELDKEEKVVQEELASLKQQTVVQRDKLQMIQQHRKEHNYHTLPTYSRPDTVPLRPELYSQQPEDTTKDHGLPWPLDETMMEQLDKIFSLQSQPQDQLQLSHFQPPTNDPPIGAQTRPNDFYIPSDLTLYHDFGPNTITMPTTSITDNLCTSHALFQDDLQTNSTYTEHRSNYEPDDLFERPSQL